MQIYLRLYMKERVAQEISKPKKKKKKKKKTTAFLSNQTK